MDEKIVEIHKICPECKCKYFVIVDNNKARCKECGREIFY